MYDIIVVGGGHAGIEAALAAARLNKKVALVTTHRHSIGHLPCNPSIGGPAKGIVVREIDALGGQMGVTTDNTYIQLKMLNTTKGPAVQSLRAQVDKIRYPLFMLEVIENESNIDIVEQSVVDLMYNDKFVSGVILSNGSQIEAQKIIITSGTYLEATTLVSDKVTKQGPDGFDAIVGLSATLRKLGFRLQRLKTGTPARVDINTVDFSVTKIEYGTNEILHFSDLCENYLEFSKQVPCYLTYTNLETHEIINSNLSKSSMYSGVVNGVGPRYCPSIEDKLVRFSDKNRHQIFLEPESNELNTIYVQGFSTSMPHDVQEKMIHSIVGLENAKILKYGYAIEYDAIDPTQLQLTLESIDIKNLYFAGQINGTSGYEEAAGQGLIAGINAALSIDNKEDFILKRSDAYIGVMIDDLVTKGTKEPYRLLTSRAEYRLLLRSDNAAKRLTEKGYQIGLVTNERYTKFKKINEEIELLKDELNKTRFTPKHIINESLSNLGSSKLYEGVSAAELLKRPEVKLDFIVDFLETKTFSKQAINQVETEIKYEGYIQKAKKQVEQFEKLENRLIPDNIEYQDIPNLAIEAQQKLTNIKPRSIGQATRISGINPSDIQNLILYLKRGIKNDNK